MAFAPPKNLNGPKMQTKMSTWTPLNHQLMNVKVSFRNFINYESFVSLPTFLTSMQASSMLCSNSIKIILV